jgi:hypothetical protein
MAGQALPIRSGFSADRIRELIGQSLRNGRALQHAMPFELAAIHVRQQESQEFDRIGPGRTVRRRR